MFPGENIFAQVHTDCEILVAGIDLSPQTLMIVHEKLDTGHVSVGSMFLAINYQYEGRENDSQLGLFYRGFSCVFICSRISSIHIVRSRTMAKNR